jgi:hypothetical protein
LLQIAEKRNEKKKKKKKKEQLVYIASFAHLLPGVSSTMPPILSVYLSVTLPAFWPLSLGPVPADSLLNNHHP